MSGVGVYTDHAKIKAVNDLSPPTNLEQFRSFLGLTGYYRKFITKFASVASPLTELTKGYTRYMECFLSDCIPPNQAVLHSDQGRDFVSTLTHEIAFAAALPNDE